MSLTQKATVYGAVHENALNDVLQALIAARPAYVTFSSATMQPIQLPGIGGVDWEVSFTDVHVDLGQGDVHLTSSLDLKVQLPAGPKDINLGVVATAHPEAIGDVLTFRLDALELVDITPDSLESLLEEVIKALLGGFLAQVQIPLRNLLPPSVPLRLAGAPVIADDQIKIYANVT